MTEKYKHAMEIIENWERVEQFVQITPGCPMWTNPKCDPGCYRLDFLNSPGEFRLKPAKRMVAWGPEDVRPGMIFRVVRTSVTSWRYPECVENGGVLIFGAWHSWGSLRSNFEYSPDGITWLKCEKEEVGE